MRCVDTQHQFYPASGAHDNVIVVGGGVNENNRSIITVITRSMIIDYCTSMLHDVIIHVFVMIRVSS